MSFLEIYFSENGAVNIKTRMHNFRKRTNDVLEADIVGVLMGMSESDWSVRIEFNIAGTDFSGAKNVIRLLIELLEERKEVNRQDKFRCVVKLDVMFAVFEEIGLIKAIHDLIVKLPNLNDICLQTCIEWNDTFEYIIEKNQVQILRLILAEYYGPGLARNDMLERIVDIFKRVNNTGRVPKITKLDVNGEYISLQAIESVGEILQNCPQLHVFSVYSIAWLDILSYFAGHRFELDGEYYTLYLIDMKKILAWANASETLKVIKFGNVEFRLDSIAALRADIEKADMEKDKPHRTCIKKLIFAGCTPIPECEAINKIMDYRNKAFELASVGDKIGLPPKTTQAIIFLLGLNT